MSICPNTTDPAWKTMVAEVGEFQAYKNYYENGEQIVSTPTRTSDVATVFQQSLSKKLTETDITKTTITPEQSKNIDDLKSIEPAYAKFSNEDIQYAIEQLIPGSEVKNIVWHGSEQFITSVRKLKESERRLYRGFQIENGIFFSRKKEGEAFSADEYGSIHTPAILNISNPELGTYYNTKIGKRENKISDAIFGSHIGLSKQDTIAEELKKFSESPIDEWGNIIVVFEPSQIILLNSPETIAKITDIIKGRDKTSSDPAVSYSMDISSHQRQLLQWLDQMYEVSEHGVIFDKLDAIDLELIAAKIKEMVVPESWTLTQSQKGNWYVSRKIPGGPVANVLSQSYSPYFTNFPKFYRGESVPNLDLKSTDQAMALEFLIKMADALSFQTGKPYKIIDKNEAITYAKTWKGEPAFYVGGTAYFIRDLLSPATLFHEFSHPIIDAIEVGDPALFDSLYTQFLLSNESNRIKTILETRYPNLKEGTSAYKKEALVWSIQLAAENKMNNINNSGPFMKFIKNLMYAIKQKLRKIFGNRITVEKLDVNSSLEDLAEMLMAGGKFNLTTVRIKNSDVEQFQRKEEEFTEALRKLENNVIVQITNDFHTSALSMVGLLKQKENRGKYKEVIDLLISQDSPSHLTQMKRELGFFEGNVEKKLDALKVDLEYAKRHTRALTNSLLRLDLVAQKMNEHLKQITDNTDNLNAVDNLYRVFNYNTVVQHWKQFIEGSINILNDNNVPTTNPIHELISGIASTFKQAESNLGIVYKAGMHVIILKQLKVTQLSMKIVYEDTMKKATTQGASKEALAEITKKYERTQITDKKLKDILEGKLGDASLPAQWLLGPLQNSDLVIGGFAKFLSDAMTDAQTEALDLLGDFKNEIQDVLKELGYNPMNTQGLANQLLFADKIGYTDDKGEWVERDVQSYLNPTKNRRLVLPKLVHELAELNRNPLTDANNEKIRLKEQEIRDHERLYWNQDFVPEFYEKFTLFDDHIGRLAFDARKKALENIQILEISRR